MKRITLNWLFKDKYIFAASAYSVSLMMYLCASSIDLVSVSSTIVKLLPLAFIGLLDQYVSKVYSPNLRNKMILMGIFNLFIFQALLYIVMNLPNSMTWSHVNNFDSYFCYSTLPFIAVIITVLLFKKKNFINILLSALVLLTVPHFKFYHVSQQLLIVTLFSVMLYFICKFMDKRMGIDQSKSEILNFNSPRVYLSTLFVTIVIAGNIFALKSTSLFGLDTPAGMICFPLTYCIGDIITELYGYNFSRDNILRGLLLLFTFVIYIKLILITLNTADPTTVNSYFKGLFLLSPALLRGTIVGYLSGEILNSKILSILKHITMGAYFIRRSFTSTLIGITTDTFAFNFSTFFGVLSLHDLFKFSVSQYILKIIIVTLGILVSAKVISLIKLSEKSDHYDPKKFLWFERLYNKKGNDVNT